jgi:hypothetical protein
VTSLPLFFAPQKSDSISLATSTDNDTFVSARSPVKTKDGPKMGSIMLDAQKQPVSERIAVASPFWVGWFFAAYQRDHAGSIPRSA